MYQSKKSIQDRKEIIEIIKKMLRDQKELELKTTTAYLSLETGYSRETIKEIFATMQEAGIVHIGKAGKVMLCE